MEAPGKTFSLQDVCSRLPTMIERLSFGPKMSDSADRLAEMGVIYWIHLHNFQIILQYWKWHQRRRVVSLRTLISLAFLRSVCLPIGTLDNFHAISNRFQFNWPAAVPFGEGIWWLWGICATLSERLACEWTSRIQDSVDWNAMGCFYRHYT